MTDAAPSRTAIALTIAGSDSSGGAGIQADLKTFSAFGVYGASVITALTAQNTLGVQGIHSVPAQFVAAQLDSVLSDLDVGAIKTGMLADAEIVATVARTLRAAPPRPLVVDPVMVATSGDILLKPEAVDALKLQLISLATLITPNLPEAAILLGCARAENEAQMADQARALLALGCNAALVKGGHASGDVAIDIWPPAGHRGFASPRVDTPTPTAPARSPPPLPLLAQGATLGEAVRRAKAFVWQGLQHGRGLGVAHGRVRSTICLPFAAPRHPEAATGMVHRGSMVRASHVGAALLQRPKNFCRTSANLHDPKRVQSHLLRVEEKLPHPLSCAWAGIGASPCGLAESRR
jgi:hydroxymethylpyrimidine/phosphomethylpyrimidine kinase